MTLLDAIRNWQLVVASLERDSMASFTELFR